MAQHLLLENRIQHALHGCLYVVDGVVDDAVQTQIHLLALRGFLSSRVRTHVEADDNGVGRCRQADVGLVDGSYATMDNLYYYFLVGEL